MKKRTLALHLIWLTILSLLLSAFAPQHSAIAAIDPWNVRITQVDTSSFPEVTVYVSVTDTNGEPVEINPSKLVLSENGVEIDPQSIRGVGELEEPLTTLLVLDISGSMNSEDKLQTAKNAAKAYIQQTRPNDQFGLLVFNTQIKLVQPLTQERDLILAAIDTLKADDDTAMYDALVQGIEILAPMDGRKAIIALTDGMDNRSHYNPLQVIQRIGPAGLSISTIGLGDPAYSYGTLAGLDEAALTSLAEEAGGVYGYANDADSLRNLYQLYGRALQSEYAITYLSPSTLRDGVNRSLQVTLQNSAAAAALFEATDYNPGGLVPEVAQPASWMLFFSILVFLLLLLVLPSLLRIFMVRKSKQPTNRIKLSNTTQKVHLKD
jgi:VWFA-related protein